MNHILSDCIAYAAIHQPVKQIFPEYIIPIQAGAALSNTKICPIRDDSGNNISVKNQEYCELTALYWIWKNDSHSIISFNHYRRYFKITPNKFPELLKQCDIIVPPVYYFRQSLEEEYIDYHNKKDWETLKKVLILMHPELQKDMACVFNDNRLIPYNMMLLRRNTLNDYCSWLFPILFEVETCLNLTSRPLYQRRVLGFMAERLFTLYVYNKRLSIQTGSVVIPEGSTYLKYAKYSLGRCYNKMIFRRKQMICQK